MRNGTNPSRFQGKDPFNSVSQQSQLGVALHKNQSPANWLLTHVQPGTHNNCHSTPHARNSGHTIRWIRQRRYTRTVNDPLGMLDAYRIRSAIDFEYEH